MLKLAFTSLIVSARKCDFFVYFSKDPCRFQNVDENEDTYSWLSGTCESPTGPIGDHTSGNGWYIIVKRITSCTIKFINTHILP